MIDTDKQIMDLEVASVDNRKLLRRLDIRIVPILALVYTLCYLDRVNIGHARLYGLEGSLNLTPTEYSWSLSVFFFGYVLFEVPSNWMMLKVAPNRWLGSLMMMWGAINISMMATTNFAGLMATRFFLGVVEAGFFPGLIFFIGCWYSRQEQGFRIACVSASSQVAGFLGGLISYSIHTIHGKGGLLGWQWLFLVEGIPTVLAGALLWLVLPPMPSNTKWLSVEERQFIKDKLSASFIDNSSTEVDKKQLIEVFKDIKIYLYTLIYFGLNVPMYSMTLLLPTIIKEMGFSNLDAMLLTSPPSALAFIVTLALAYRADRQSSRSFYLIASLTVTTIGFLIFILVTNVYGKYFSFFLIMPGIVSTFPSILAWANSNFVGSTRASTCSAFMISIGNLSGVVGGQLFRPEEGSRFLTSNLINLVTLLVVLCLTLLLRRLIKRENHRRNRLAQLDPKATDDGFRFVL